MDDILQYQTVINEWIPCEGIHPYLPPDTIVQVTYRNGEVERPVNSSRHKWGNKSKYSKDNYDVISYRIVKV
jgi:hypothetical protein